MDDVAHALNNKKPTYLPDPMKNKFLLIPASISILALCSCDEDHSQRTTVSQSLVSKNTIVSHSRSDGTFTRTQYGTDFFGNRTTNVTQGHANATQQADFLIGALKLLFIVLTDTPPTPSTPSKDV